MNEETAAERCTLAAREPENPEAWKCMEFPPKTFLLSSASLAGVRPEMGEAQGHYFAGNRRVVHPSVVMDFHDS